VIFKSGEQHKIWNEQAQLNGADADAKLKRSCFKRLRRNNTKTTKTYPVFATGLPCSLASTRI